LWLGKSPGLSDSFFISSPSCASLISGADFAAPSPPSAASVATGALDAEEALADVLAPASCQAVASDLHPPIATSPIANQAMLAYSRRVIAAATPHEPAPFPEHCSIPRILPG